MQKEEYNLIASLRTGSPRVWWEEKRRTLRGQGRGDDGVNYFFQHVPKTAGTSFRHQLYRVFSQKEIFPNLADLKQNGGRYRPFRELRNLTPDFLADKNLLMGHLPWHAGKHLFGQEPRHLLFLRDPIERMVSLFHHLKTYGPSVDATDREILDLIDQHNQQTRIIAGPGIKGDVKPEHIKKARERLATVDFIGLTECYAESVDLANKIFQWNLGKPKQLNSRINPQEHIQPEVMKIIIEKNQIDYEVYEIAKERFNGLKKEFTVSPASSDSRCSLRDSSERGIKGVES